VEILAELAGPPMPPGMAYLFDWFLELDVARGSSGFGPNPIGYGEMEAWSRLTGRLLLPWEVVTLRHLDSARLNVFAEGTQHDRADRH
jgi:hypothetical protein